MTKIIMLTLFVFLLPILTGCGNEDETYVQAFAALESGEYNSALNILRSIPEHNDHRNIREQAEQGLLRLEIDSAIQNGRFSSAIRLLDSLPPFSEADQLRNEAVYGINRENIIREINEALTFGRYDDVLEILDSNPNFNDEETGFRDEAMSAIFERENMLNQYETDTVEMLSGMISEMFQIATLEIESRNMAMREVIPGGFANPGTITLILEFDSTVSLGVANPQNINMRITDNTIYVQESSIQIDILNSVVRNFEQIEAIRSNPLVTFTPAVNNQIFQAQRELEAEMAERFVTERTIDSARRSFMNSLQGFMQGLGFEVRWE